MSLPPGFLDEIRTRLSLGQVVGRKVTWDARKSNQGKGDLWAPCPFHHEKTASFHVDDRKGYYYCFGCHAKGDAISFVRETENVSFMEAVEILAGEAGMQMPARDPKAQEKADRRTLLAEVMEMAVRWFRMQLQSGAGEGARDYLAGRGQPDGWLDRWEIGFAPDTWQGLWDHLSEKGVAPDLILGAGLAKPSQKGGKPYDTFRGRIMFPIRDARGRCIAFGGRAMDPNDNAKYLNSPETELFDKGRSLYNHGPAREAAGKGHDLIVAEGYMDVIALSEAGFKGAVAPLGTAVTEHQLAMLWRVAPEPVVTLDGDTAGKRAAARLVDLALPDLSSSNSLFFVTLPDGMDPDDFIKEKGSEALSDLFDQERVPLVRALWLREFHAAPTNTPEQKAGLDKRLRAAINKIADADIKRYYEAAIKEYRWDEFKPANYAPPFKKRPGFGKFDRQGPLTTTRNSLLGAQSGAKSVLTVNLDAFHIVRERIVAALALSNPAVAIAFREGLERFEVADHAVRAILLAMIDCKDAPSRDDAKLMVLENLGSNTVERVLGDPYVKIHPAMKKTLDGDLILHEMAENIARVSADRAARLEIDEASEDIHLSENEVLTYRLGQSARELDKAVRGEQKDSAEYDLADNGAQISRDERNAFDALLDSIRFSKPGR